MRLDARIPVLVQPWPAPPMDDAALPDPDPLSVLLLAGGPELHDLPAGHRQGWATVRLVEGEPAASTTHAAACACCAGRSPLATMLSTLFLQRALGRLALFRRVLLLAPAPVLEGLRTMLESDALVAGRYRSVPGFVEN